jgi:ABC-type uncharacterized transport system ATPase subunit
VKDLPTDELTKTFVHEKYVDLVLDSGEKIKEIIELKNESVSEGLKRLLSQYNVRDVDVYDVDLETVIREMYEAQKV